MENQQNRFMLSLLAYYAQRDLDVKKLCNLSGIDFKSVRENKTLNFSPKNWNDIWLNAVKNSKDALFGLHFGESMQLAALGVVGEIIKTSNTIGHALTQVTALTHLITDLFIMKVNTETDVFSIIFHPAKKVDQTDPAYRQTAEFFMAFTIHELDGLLLNKIKPQRVTFPYETISNQEYERVLRCKPQEGTSYCIQFNKSYWDETIITGNYSMQATLLHHVSESSDTASDKFKMMVYNYLLTKSYLGIASIKDVAANFNLSVRTMQRKLGEEDTSFQSIADQVRKQLALKYLKSGEHQIKEISYILGYNELSAFTRAFKRWTGSSPTSYY
nr:AraC family transcriptional regulator [Pedobacter panaciterrae]